MATVRNNAMPLKPTDAHQAGARAGVDLGLAGVLFIERGAIEIFDSLDNSQDDLAFRDDLLTDERPRFRSLPARLPGHDRQDDGEEVLSFGGQSSHFFRLARRSR